MAADDNKGGKYPKISRQVWFGLREKLKQRVPGEISPSYVATAFGMEPASAASNVLPALRIFGLIDDVNKPQDLALDWREDSKYAEVCQTIIEKTYPRELRDLFHSPDASQEEVRAWFARTARVGSAAANKFAITYLMLLEADLSKANGASPKAKPANGKASKPALGKTRKPARVTVASPVRVSGEQAGAGASGASHGKPGVSIAPKLHIDIQIHIAPDSSADQIDKIFESMSKHLKDFFTVNDGD